MNIIEEFMINYTKKNSNHGTQTPPNFIKYQQNEESLKLNSEIIQVKSWLI